MGLQVPPSERRTLFRSLAPLGYPFREETDNRAYQLFAGTGARSPVDSERGDGPRPDRKR
jgi:hypothetical protein